MVWLRFKENRKFLRTASPLFRILFFVGLFIALNAAAVGLFFLFKVFPLLDVNADMLAVICFAVFLLLFFQSLGAINGFYKSRDNKTLLSMPVKQNELFFSQIIALYISNFITNLFVLYPLLLWFGLASQTITVYMYVDLTYYAVMPFLIIIIPAIAVLAASLISVPLQILNVYLKKNPKINITVLAFVSVIILALYMFVIIRFSKSVSGNDDITKAMINVYGFFVGVSKYLLFFRSVSALAIGKLFYLAPLVLIAAASVLSAGLYYVVRPFYYRLAGEGLLPAGLSTGSKNEKQSGTVPALLIKEFKSIFRSGEKVLTYFLFTVIMPFVIIAYGMLLKSLIVDEIGEGMIAGTHFMVLCLFALLSNLYSANVVSVEGRNAYYIKTMPVSYRLSVGIKVLFNTILTVAALSLTTCISIIFTPERFSDYMLAYAAAAVLGVGGIFLNAVLDINRPATSKNGTKLTFNTAIAGLFAMVVGVGLGILHIVVLKTNGARAAWLIDFAVVGFIAMVSASAYFLTVNRTIECKEL